MTWVLLAAGAGLILALAFIAWRTWTAAAPLCDSSFPARSTEYPSSLFVFAVIAAFVLGHLTSQVGIVRRGRANKSLHKNPRKEQEELGEGRWKDAKAVMAVNAGVATFLFLVTFLMGIEALTLGTHQWPITYYARCATYAQPPGSLGGAIIYAFVVSRWLWVFKGE
jgi:hypothetical protein